MGSNSTATSTNTLNSVPEKPFCEHGSCDLKTSFSLDNPGRRYWKCPLWSQGGGACSFFLWHEPPYEGHVRDVFLEIIRKYNFYKAKVFTAERDCSKWVDAWRSARDELEAKLTTIGDLKDELEAKVTSLGDLRLQLDGKVKELGEIKIENQLLRNSLTRAEFKLRCWVYFMMACAFLMLGCRVVEYHKSGGSAEVPYMLN